MSSNSKALGPILPAVTEWADEGGIPKDDPFHKIITGLAGQGDRLEGLIKDFGPGAAKLAAEAARREVAIGMRSVARRFSFAGVTIAFAAGAALLGLGYMMGSQQLVNTEIGPMPREMARIVGMQDWEAQWAMCASKPIRQGDVDWCYLPMVVNIQRKGN